MLIRRCRVKMCGMHVPLLLAALAATVIITTADVTDLSTANTDFALDLYRKLASEIPGQNLFFSPLSISTSLALIHAGAVGNTKQEIASTLNFDDLETDAALHEAYQTLLSDLNNPDAAYNLSVASRLYGSLDYNFAREYTRLTEEIFSASTQEVDFENDGERVREMINDWVERMTRDKIQDLIPSGALDKNTDMVLVNAIYFSGNWQLPFDEEDTELREFYLNATHTKQMEMMYIDKYLYLAEIPELKCRILRLPYKDRGEVSFYSILPDEIDGLPDIENQLTTETLNQAIEAATEIKVKVTLPKFKMATDINLKRILEDMGVIEMFDANKADLSNIDATKDCVITEIVHKAFVDVNERGTEAAGATFMSVGSTWGQPDIRFVVDRPSLFLIRDTSTASVLFLGRLVDVPGDDGARIGEFGFGNQEAEAVNSAGVLAKSFLVWLLCGFILW